jgi:hypothetical protein
MISINARQVSEINETHRAIQGQIYAVGTDCYLGLKTGKLQLLLPTEYSVYGIVQLNQELNYINEKLSNGIKVVEVDLGSTGKLGGQFLIRDPQIKSGNVVISQAAAIYTGKGNLYDESEMDIVQVNGYVSGLQTITAFWNSRYFVKGNFKFNYQIV